jgi:DNA-binding beta-propeller fold protein YncE
MFLRAARIFAAQALLILGLSAFAQPGEPAYRILKVYKLGGIDHWDYLTFDPASRRIFISRSTHVIVVDADSGKPVGDIPDTPGVHGIALAPDLGRGFTSNGKEDTVSIFDIESLKPIGKVKVGSGPDAILYDPATKRVFAFNGKGQDATAIDAAKGEVVGTIPLGGRPEFGVSDERGKLFVNIEDKDELVAIDAKKMKVDSRWPLAPCQEPTGLSMDRKNHRLFSGCHDKLMAVVDADNGEVITTLPIGAGVDATAFDPERSLAFASCGDGSLTIVKEDSPSSFRVVQNAPTMQGARTMTLDPKTHDALLVRAQLGPPPDPHSLGEHAIRGPIVVPDTFVVLVVGTSAPPGPPQGSKSPVN